MRAGSISVQQGPGIYRTTNGIVDTVVKMWRRVSRIAGSSNVPDYVARAYDVTFPESPVPVEVCVVVHLSPGAENIYDLAAEPVGSDSEDDTLS
jgi:hypothetical protein